MPYRGGSWSQRGGNDADETYLRTLQAWASKDGPLHPKQSIGLPDGVKSAFSRFVDIVQREENAMAGILDVLADRGKEGESVGGRFIREWLGGTKLGNAFGVDAPDRETFSDVLAGMGVGEGGRLSDIVGDDWKLIKYFDPTVRGTAGTALSIIGSPSTYFGFGLGKVVKAMGRGGEIVALNAKGQQLLANRYSRSLAAVARRHGIDLSGGVTAKLERDVLKAESLKRGLDYLGAEGENRVRALIQRRAESFVARGVQSGRLGKDLVAKSSVRFGDLGLLAAFDQRLANVRGIELVELEKLSAPARAVGRGIRAAIESKAPGAAFVKDLDNKLTAIHDFFNAVPRMAKKVPGLERMIQNRNARVRGAVSFSEDLINRDVFGGAKNFRKFSADDLRKLSDAIEGNRINEWVDAAVEKGLGEEYAHNVITRWNDIASKMGGLEVEMGMQKAEAMGKYANKYISHVVEGRGRADYEAVLERFGIRPRPVSSGSVGRFAEERHFDTLDELRDFVAKNNLSDVEIVDNAHTLMVRRTAAHMAGIADADFVTDIMAAYRATPQNVFREFYKEVGEQAKGGARVDASPAELQQVADLLARSSSVSGKEAADEAINKALKINRLVGQVKETKKGIKLRDIETLKNMRPELRAAVVREMFSRAESLDHFANLTNKYRSVLDAMGLDKHEWSSGISDAALRNTTYQGRPLKPYKFKKGRLAGETATLPEAVIDTMKRMSGAWIDTPEVAELLSGYDRLVNFFKLSVTTPFPAFHARNAYSNVFSSLLDVGLAALNPAMHYKAIKIMAGHDYTLKTATGSYIPAEAIRSSARALDIWQDTIAFADLSRTKSVLSEIEATDYLTRMKRAFYAPGRAIENEARMMHYIVSLERGMSFQDASRATKQFLFDYEDLSDNEKRIMRRLVPFYTWQRKAVELQVRQILTNPGRQAAGIRLVPGEQGPGPDYLPEYVRGDIKLRLESKPGKADTFLTGIDLPVNSINSIWAGGVGSTIRHNLSMLTPFLKNPLEFGIGVDSLTKQPIEGRRFMGKFGPVVVKRWPQWAKDYIQFKEVTSESTGVKYYTANATRTWAILKAPLVSRLISTSVTAEEVLAEFRGGRGGGAQLLYLLSGLSLREYDLSDAQRRSMRTKIRALETLLLESGEANEFRRVYVKKGPEPQRRYLR